ncbi:uncharacterized protein LOC125186202 isoform X2 [Salvia hispanica]|uniref:uncharacterized protein LOC125186202 isoform X2 n=1 Tax=Salvia hispanica TaxID=49212 RepID=UPI0020096D83|nr:uncharacterized protein LOC125186202 isoform X2 [Salvia hispanica]
MPATKLCSSGTLNAMKSEVGNDSLDTFIRQAVGKEPLLPLPRTVDSSVPWIQLFQALDQPDLPGWPLMTPVKVQMQRCKKCSREFCSPINYRRHIRVHRRSLNINKDWHKNRDLLAVFWDKLSLEQAKELVSFNDIILKDIPGSSVVKALASSLRRPGVWTLPQAYVKAGATLLDIIQVKPSRLPISSQELFSILDDASESTFLCAGTAESLQKYVFDGETAKNILELKNLVAFTSFLFEQQLVKAWVADKDVEALRCHKLLVEEEEAEQKRQVAILERKKQKKLRQKQQKVREQYYGCSRDLNVYVDAIDRPTSAEASDLSSPSDPNSNSKEVPTTSDSVQPQNKESDEDIGAQFDARSEHKKHGDSPAVELQMVVANGIRHVATNCLQALKSQRGSRYGANSNLNLRTLNPELIQKFGPSKDRSLHNGNKVWTKKLKTNNDDGENPRPPSLQDQQASHPNERQDTCGTEQAVLKKKTASEKPAKSNSLQSGTNRVATRLWRPVSRGESKNVPPVGRSNGDPEDNATLSKVHEDTSSSERSGQSQSLDSDGCHNGKQSHVVSVENAQPGLVPFSIEAAKEFFARRWKDAISGDHVKLVLSSEHKPHGCSDIQHASDPPRSNAPNHDENQFGRTLQVQVAIKPEKSVKFKYIPKQKLSHR